MGTKKALQSFNDFIIKGRISIPECDTNDIVLMHAGKKIILLKCFLVNNIWIRIGMYIYTEDIYIIYYNMRMHLPFTYCDIEFEVGIQWNDKHNLICWWCD